jgi:hypothetical protein
MRGVRVATIVLFVLAVVCVASLAAWYGTGGTWPRAKCGTRAATRAAPATPATPAAAANSAVTGASTCPQPPGKPPQASTACASQNAKQAWWCGQAGPGVVQGSDVGFTDPKDAPSGWEGDSGQPGVAPSVGCVLQGALSKGGVPLPGQGQLFPYGTAWTADGGLQDLCQAAGVTGPCARGVSSVAPTPTQKAPTAITGLRRSTKPPRTALYHGGVVGAAALDFGVFKRYMQDVVRFVAARGINRLFIVLTPWDDKTTPFFSDPQNVVDAVIVPLYKAWKQAPTNWVDSERPTVGIVPYLRPKDGNYNVLAPDGGPPPLPIEGGLCAVCTDGADCGGKAIQVSQLTPDKVKTAADNLKDCPGNQYQPLRPAGGPIDSACRKPCQYNAGADKGCVGCNDTTTCRSPSGCPANADEVMYWVQQVNAKVRASTEIDAADRDHFVITNLVTDGEDAGVYQDDWGMVQLSQMAWRRGATAGGAATADVRNIGYAKGMQATPTDVLKDIQAGVHQGKPAAGEILGPSAPADSAAAKAAGFPGGIGQWTYMPETYWYMDELFPCSGNPYQLENSSAGDGSEPDLASTTQSTICTLNSSYRKFARAFQGERTAVKASAATVDPDTDTLAYMYMRYLEAAATGNFPGPSGPETSEPRQYHGVKGNDLGAWQEATRGLQQLAYNVRNSGDTTSIIPMLSFENLSATRQPNGAGGGPGDPTRDCLALNYFGTGAPKPDLCGTFDGFSYWDWDDFFQFCWLFSDYARFADFDSTVGPGQPPPDTDPDVRGWIGLYESQFIPAAWMPGGKFSDSTDRWDEYWRFSKACDLANFPCGADRTNPDAECKKYAADPTIVKTLQDSCPGTSEPGYSIDLEAFSHCHFDDSKAPGTVFYCNVDTKFSCTTDAQCNGHGTCNTATGVCDCTAPYKGDDCSTHPPDCSLYPEDACGPHGTCTPDAKDPSKPHTCVCNNAPGANPFYTGDKCDVAYDPTKNPCYARCSDSVTCGPYCAAQTGPDGYCDFKSSDLSTKCFKSTISCCKTCTTAADCPTQSKGSGHATCVGGYCGYTPAPAGTCKIDSDCPSLNASQCVGGQCVGCTSDKACVGRGSDTTCYGGKCGPAAQPTECSSSKPCQSAALPQCTAGKCVVCSGSAGSAACAARTDGKTVCSGGACVAPPPPGHQCQYDTDCTQWDATPQCVAGTCGKCTGPSACLGGHGAKTTCDVSTGACVVPPPECANDPDCKSDWNPQCVAGNCQPCTSDAACHTGHGTRTSCVVGPDGKGSCGAPPPAECSAVKPCQSASKAQCTNGKCVPCNGSAGSAACAARTDKLTVCSGGTCVAPPPPPECSAVQPCQSASKAQCTDGACVACTGNAACAARKDGLTVCKSGACVAPPAGSCTGRDPAKLDAFCQAVVGSYCQQGRVCHGSDVPCCQTCAADSDCPSTGAVSCQHGFCAPSTGPVEDCDCASDPAGCDAFCAAAFGTYCQNGLNCHGNPNQPCCQSCADDAGCPAGTHCRAGKCVPTAGGAAFVVAGGAVAAPDLPEPLWTGERPFEW